MILDHDSFIFLVASKKELSDAFKPKLIFPVIQDVVNFFLENNPKYLQIFRELPFLYPLRKAIVQGMINQTEADKQKINAEKWIVFLAFAYNQPLLTTSKNVRKYKRKYPNLVIFDIEDFLSER